jgi:hypothetical protein
MAFSIDGLTDYVEQNKLPLLTTAVFDAKTQQLMQKRVGIKSQEALNLMDTDAVFQLASTCAWNASGTTTFSQRVISVARVKVQEELCPRALETKWLATQLSAGSNYESVPFEQAFATQKAKKIAANIETAIWQSTTATGLSGWTGATATISGDATLNKTVGLLHLMEKTAASGSIVSSLAGAAFSDATVVSAFENVYQKIPVAIVSKPDLVAFCGWDVYRLLVNRLVGLNLFQGDLGNLSSGEFFFPATNMKVVAVNGMNNTRRIVATSLENLFYGTDLLSDEDQFRIWASYDNDQVRFQAALKYGVQFAFPEQMVLYKASDATTPAG